ncbi:MAG: hypothetical protein KBH11_07715 [Bacteroidia bacterium]|nr:hypothetical protein [Bacteroidota bacterium]MBP9082947.1 hypothetical protein [Bacteroidia bacterium]MBK7390131.1 hypothetical protein [Bacteroidota bacterium]MBK7969804.1 hypothetical protein [Bacteroidota bacterium]MBK8874318.1 hypothetical protein [Bacteroidota bacterium]
MKSIFTLLLLIATASSCTMDQSHLTAKSSDINFEGCPVWTIEGLGSNSILKNNFSFKKEYKADSTLQIGNYIRAMIQDKSGNIWVGTHGKGLARFDGKMLKFFNEDDNFNSIVVRDIKEDQKGWMWIATNKGVYSYDGKSFVNYDITSGMDDNEVWSVLIDQTIATGTTGIWFGTEAGAFFYDGRSFTKLKIPQADLSRFPSAYKAPELINSMVQDKAGRIWFATNGNGVFCYDKKVAGDDSNRLTQYSQKNGLCNDVVQGIYIDKKESLWFSTRFGGASKFDGKTFTTFNDKNGLKNNFVWTVYEDRSGNVWFATAGGGVTKYDGKKYTTYTSKDGLPDDYVQSILEDADGNLWFGAGTGLARFDGKKFISYQGKSDGC